MIDVKPEINALLSSIPGVTVSDAFPASAAKTPHITMGEAANVDPLMISNGPLSDIVIQIDIWHKSSTGTLAAAVDEKMNSVGFRRQFAADLSDPSGIKRKTMRYGGKVDARTNLVHQ